MKQEKKVKKNKNVTLRVGEQFFSRLENHIRNLKCLDKATPTKKEWLELAIEEKLKRGINSTSLIPKDKYVTFTVTKDVHEDLEERIQLIKQNKKRSFSKKQWMEEAIMEKLEREEEEARSLLEKKLSRN